MRKFLAIIALTMAFASPAFAQSYNPDIGSGNIVQVPGGQTAWSGIPQGAARGGATSAYGAVTPFGSPGAAQPRQSGASSAREAALRECSAMGRRYTQTTWGTMELHQFRTCMAQRGHAE
jgi:hypothetical protein